MDNSNNYAVEEESTLNREIEPEADLWKKEPHTEAKHKILDQYLEAWFPILISANTIVHPLNIDPTTYT